MSALTFRATDGKNELPVAHSDAPNGAALPVIDTFSRVSAAVTKTDSVPSPAVALGHKLIVICTVAGNVKVGFMDGSTLTFPVVVGYNQFSFRFAQVFSTLTTATATYFGAF